MHIFADTFLEMQDEQLFDVTLWNKVIGRVSVRPAP
jgi:hypothetical protein